MKVRCPLYEAFPCRFFWRDFFNNQGEAETLVLGGNLAGGAEHGGMSFLKEAII